MLRNFDENRKQKYLPIFFKRKISSESFICFASSEPIYFDIEQIGLDVKCPAQKS